MIISSSATTGFLAQLALMLPTLLFSISFHECCHALVAYCLGDNTAYKKGRISLNPFAHLDWMNIFFITFFHIGIAVPVPFNQDNFKYPRLFTLLTTLAGPCSNLILAALSLLILKYLPLATTTPAFVVTMQQIFTIMLKINIMLCTFNLIPIPPLDGSHLVTMLLRKRFPGAVAWLYRYGFLIILVMIFAIPPVRTALIACNQAIEQSLRNLIL